MKRVSFSEKQPEYRYFALGNGLADVFIYSFVGEDTEKVGEEETETKVFLYDVNEFRVPQDLVTEDMVKANPAKYLDYTPQDESTVIDRIEAQVMFTALMTDTLLEEESDNGVMYELKSADYVEPTVELTAEQQIPLMAAKIEELQATMEFLVLDTL